LSPQFDCLAAPRQSLPLLAALEFQGAWRVDAVHALDQTPCGHALLQAEQNAKPIAPAGWHLVGTVRRPTDRQQHYLLLQRAQVD
jgi:hypothetical protein